MPELTAGKKYLISDLKVYQDFAIANKLPLLESALFPNSRKAILPILSDTHSDDKEIMPTEVIITEISDAQIDESIKDADNAIRVCRRLLLEDLRMFETNHGAFIMRGESIVTAAVDIPQLIANEGNWNNTVDEQTSLMFQRLGPILSKYPSVELQSTIDSITKRKDEVAKLKETPSA